MYSYYVCYLCNYYFYYYYYWCYCYHTHARTHTHTRTPSDTHTHTQKKKKKKKNTQKHIHTHDTLFITLIISQFCVDLKTIALVQVAPGEVASSAVRVVMRASLQVNNDNEISVAVIL